MAEFNCTPHGVGNASFYNLMLSPGIVQPGDIIYLHKGVYDTHLSTNGRVCGSVESPIIIQPAAGERVEITKGLVLNGAHLWLIGMDITSDTNGVLLGAGAFGTRVLGNYIHDCKGHGVATFGDVACEVSENIIWQNGTSTLHHGIYCGSNATLKRNVLYWNSGRGIHAWKEFGGIEDVVVEENVAFANDCGNFIMGVADKAAFIRNFEIVNNILVTPVGLRLPCWGAVVHAPGVASVTGATVHGNTVLGAYGKAMKIAHFADTGQPMDDIDVQGLNNVEVTEDKKHPKSVTVIDCEHLDGCLVVVINSDGDDISIEGMTPNTKHTVRNVLDLESKKVYPDDMVSDADGVLEICQDYRHHKTFKNHVGRYDYEPGLGCYLVKVAK